MKWAPGMRFRFSLGRPNLGSFAGCIGIVASKNDIPGSSSWWFTMEDREHPDYTAKPRWHVAEVYMEPVYPEHGFRSVEQADAWLDSYTSAEAS